VTKGATPAATMTNQTAAFLSNPALVGRRFLDWSQASTVTYLPPVVALLIGCLFVGEPLRAMDLIAMSAIFGGVYAIQRRGRG
jgi:drug/metabolite transporter (DMT)-like permease